MNRTCQYLLAYTIMLSIVLFLLGCNSSNNDNAPLNDPDSSMHSPSAPSALQVFVYSSQAIELAWNAATDNGIVVEYQVYRDGNLIASLNALRFFENALTAGTTYTYNVQAVDDEGYVSAPSELIITTLDEGPIISEANYSVILPYIVKIANGKLFDDLRIIVNDTDASWLSGTNFEDIGGLTLVEQSTDPTGVWRIFSYACEFGGTYEYYRDTFIQFGGHFRGYYDECQIESNNVSGNFDRKATVNKAPPYNERLSSQYSLTVLNELPDNLRNFTGQIDVDNSQVANRYSVIEASYSEHNLMWSTTISDIDIEVYATEEQPLAGYAVPFSRSFDANFRVQGPQTGDEPLSVVMQFKTNDETHLNYRTGSLEVTAEDGSSMRMDLANSDLDVFQLDFSHASGVSALTVFWSEDYRLLCLQTPMFDTLLTPCE